MPSAKCKAADGDTASKVCVAIARELPNLIEEEPGFDPITTQSGVRRA
jgi:hypothetical protein